MYKYLLFRNDRQIYSSNDYLAVLSWQLDDSRHNKDAKYEVVDQSKEPGFRQALH